MSQRSDERLSFATWAIMSLVAWAFLAAMTAFAGWAVGDSRGLVPFFLVLAIGFTVASVFDFVCDRLAARPPDAAEAPGDKPKAL